MLWTWTLRYVFRSTKQKEFHRSTPQQQFLLIPYDEPKPNLLDLRSCLHDTAMSLNIVQHMDTLPTFPKAPPQCQMNRSRKQNSYVHRYSKSQNLANAISSGNYFNLSVSLYVSMLSYNTHYRYHAVTFNATQPAICVNFVDYAVDDIKDRWRNNPVPTYS